MVYIFDIILFNAINGFAGQNVFADMIGIFFAAVLPYLLFLLLAVLFFRPVKDKIKNREIVLSSLAAGLVARFLLKTVIVFFYQRPRPYMVLPSAHKLIATFSFDNFQSFPSGHALFFFAASTAIYHFNKKLGIFFFACSVCIGVARIYAGVHWPSDIIFGAVLGAIVGATINWVYAKNHEKNSHI